MFGGIQVVANFGLWIFVYGMMVYLPVYTLPSERGARQPKVWHYALAALSYGAPGCFGATINSGELYYRVVKGYTMASETSKVVVRPKHARA